MRDAAECRFRPAEAEPFPQHARDFRDVGVGIRVVGAATDDNEQRFRAFALRRNGGDAVGRGFQQFRVDTEVAREPYLGPPMRGHEAVHLPRQVVLDVTRGEQHPRHGQYSGRAACMQFNERFADRRAGEFEIAVCEIAAPEPGAQRRRGLLELVDGLGVAAAVAAQQHSRFAHRRFPPE